MVVDGQRLTSFCSNDYLEMASHPTVTTAFEQGLREYGAGAGASHRMYGHMTPHQQLEQALVEFSGRV